MRSSHRDVGILACVIAACGSPREPLRDVEFVLADEVLPIVTVGRLEIPVSYEESPLSRNTRAEFWARIPSRPSISVHVYADDDSLHCDPSGANFAVALPDGWQTRCGDRVSRVIHGLRRIRCLADGSSDEAIEAAWRACASLSIRQERLPLAPRDPHRLHLASGRDSATVGVVVPLGYMMARDELRGGWSFRRTYGDPELSIRIADLSDRGSYNHVCDTRETIRVEWRGGDRTELCSHEGSFGGQVYSVQRFMRVGAVLVTCDGTTRSREHADALWDTCATMQEVAP